MSYYILIVTDRESDFNDPYGSSFLYTKCSSYLLSFDNAYNLNMNSCNFVNNIDKVFKFLHFVSVPYFCFVLDLDSNFYMIYINCY